MNIAQVDSDKLSTLAWWLRTIPLRICAVCHTTEGGIVPVDDIEEIKTAQGDLISSLSDSYKSLVQLRNPVAFETASLLASIRHSLHITFLSLVIKPSGKYSVSPEEIDKENQRTLAIFEKEIYLIAGKVEAWADQGTEGESIHGARQKRAAYLSRYLISTTEIQDFFGISRGTVRNHCRPIRGGGRGKTTYFSLWDVICYIESKSIEPRNKLTIDQVIKKVKGSKINAETYRLEKGV